MPDTMMTEQSDAAPLYRNRSPEIAKLAAALCKAQGAMEGAKKDAEAVITGTQKRTYADLASVWEAVRKPLADNGLAVIQFPRTAQNGVEIETTLAHSSGEFMSDVLWVPCGKFDAQGLGSAITYGRRYALMAVTGIAPVDDDGAAAVASHKPGPAGMASGGTDFRPERRQMPTQSSANGRNMATADPQLVDHDRPKGTLPAKPGTPAAGGDAIKMAERAKKAIAFFKDDMTTPDAAKAYWMEREGPIEEIESAMPKEYERMLDAYNQCLERKNVRAV